MFRKMLLVLAGIATLGLVIGLAGCPQKETSAPRVPRPLGSPGERPIPPSEPTDEEEALEEEAPEAEEATTEEGGA